MTFQAHSGVAQSQIAELVWRKVLFDDHSEYGVVAGVFPAHVAVAISQLGVGVPVFVPVSVPAPAAEGETRGGGFVHSHWEKIT
jgi:hypothetical protein